MDCSFQPVDDPQPLPSEFDLQVSGEVAVALVPQWFAVAAFREGKRILRHLVDGLVDMAFGRLTEFPDVLLRLLGEFDVPDHHSNSGT